MKIASFLHVIMLSSLPYFSTLAHKRHDFRGKFIEHKIYIDFVYNFIPKNFSF